MNAMDEACTELEKTEPDAAKSIGDCADFCVLKRGALLFLVEIGQD